MSEELQDAVVESASPILRFVGHSLAVALGLVGLTLVFLIPVALVHGLVAMGVAELGGIVKGLESALLYGEIAFFSLTLLIGAFELLLCEVLRAVQKVREHSVTHRPPQAS